jgi:recombination protein RecA
VQRNERDKGPAYGAVFWCGIEPFSKRWARTNGFFIPFSEELVYDQAAQEWVPADPFAAATEIELHRMQEAGITDPYAEVTPFVLLKEDRGDVALDATLKAIRSNQFALVVVDSLGMAKSSAWLYEKDVQEASDFDRTAKMIGDYTARAALACNARYDENNQLSKDGTNLGQTTVINLAQIVTNIGTMAHAPWKKYSMKGGEGAKHNHHAVIFVWKGEQLRVEMPGDQPAFIFGQEMKLIAIKSKLGAPWRQGSIRLYFDDYEQFRAGDVDRARDLFALSLIAGTVKQAGAHYSIEEEKIGVGKEAAISFLRENQDWFTYLLDQTTTALRG